MRLNDIWLQKQKAGSFFCVHRLNRLNALSCLCPCLSPDASRQSLDCVIPDKSRQRLEERFGSGDESGGNQQKAIVETG